MSGHTKTLPTDCVELRFLVPADHAGEVRRAVAPYIAKETTAVLWREAAGCSDADLPGVLLHGGRVKEGLTQAKLAALVGIPQRHVTEMEHGKRPIGREMAKRLAKVLKVDYRVFL